jgi:4a-hydroxytetrahydrobiopterin dehydratase
MQNLHELNCTRPRKEDRLDSEKVAECWRQIPDWKVILVDGMERLERVFGFKNFTQALNFTNKVGALAEAQDHHPAILTEWGRVTVTYWTHFTGGLHLNDFIMAAKTDRLAVGDSPPIDL